MHVSTKGLVLSAILASGALAAGDAQAGITFADVGKNVEYLQTDAAGATVSVGAFFFARAFYNSGDFDNGSVSFNGTTLPFNSIAFDCCGSTGGQFQTGYISKADMDATYPTSTSYALTATKTGNPAATQVVNVLLPDDLYTTTPIPTFDAASFNALNSLTPGQGIDIGTGIFGADPGANGAQSFLSIFDLTSGITVYNDFGSNSRANWLVGSGIFQAGHSYEAQLIFDQLLAGNDGGVPVTGRDDLRSDVFFTVPQAAAVPEPATWAVMVLGFGLMGAALRRRGAALT